MASPAAPLYPSRNRAVGARQIVGSFTDAAAIASLAKECDVLTAEIEHVNAEAVADAQAATGVVVHPSSRTLALIQDKFLLKEHMRRVGVPVGDFCAAETL